MKNENPEYSRFSIFLKSGTPDFTTLFEKKNIWGTPDLEFSEVKFEIWSTRDFKNG